ncbi:Fe(3+)-siderophore ABC transporter permease [Leucothrix sargassi]|nr:Fe(3+)-siderophore ABC transporter permease [Leucothrix sargassi]
MSQSFLVQFGEYSLVFNRRSLLVLGLLWVSCVALAISSLVTGSNLLSITDLSSALSGGSLNPLQKKILWELRLPRLVTALFAGAALGLSGAVFQSISRNPLGSPDVLGFTSGSAVLAVSYIIFIGQSHIGVGAAVLLGGFTTAFIIYLLAIRGQALSSMRIILVGIGVGATFSAVTGLLLVKGELESAMLANLWLSGSLDGRQWGHALLILCGVLLCYPIISWQKKSLQMTEMGEMLAGSLGVHVQRSRLLSLFTAVILVSLATAVVGPIAFIALAAPHIASGLIGRHQLPILASGLIGALLLLLADTASKYSSITAHLPVGRITAVVGGCYLIGLLMWQKFGKKS